MREHHLSIETSGTRQEFLRWLFGTEYRFEAYKPPARRTYGSYILLFLADNEIRGRADMKTNKVYCRSTTCGLNLSQPGLK